MYCGNANIARLDAYYCTGFTDASVFHIVELKFWKSCGSFVVGCGLPACLAFPIEKFLFVIALPVFLLLKREVFFGGCA